MKCSGTPSRKAIGSHRLKFPELNGRGNTTNIELPFLLSFLYTATKKKAQNPQAALGNRCLCVTWFSCCCLLPPVLSIPAAREDAKHSGSQKVVLPCCCWLKNHLALHIPPPKLDLATMKLEPKSSRWHCRGVSRNSISVTVYSVFSRWAIFKTQFSGQLLIWGMA